MMRAAYRAELGKISVKTGVLGIQRQQRSILRDTLASSPAEFVTRAPIDQLQINILANLRHRITGGSALSASAALPLLKRPVNVDGLSRSFRVSLALAAEF